jgi:hypothetical protein
MANPAHGDAPSPTIAASHASNDVALEMARAIRRAEVALLGDDAAAYASGLEPLLARAGATLVEAPTPQTRFVVPGPSAGEEDLLAASENGALLVRPEDVEALVDAYTAVWFPEGLAEATRRAREEARKLALTRARGVKTRAERWRSDLESERTTRMQLRAPRPQGGLGPAGIGDPGRPGHLTEQERRIQESVRSARAAEQGGSLRRLIS